MQQRTMVNSCAGPVYTCSRVYALCLRTTMHIAYANVKLRRRIARVPVSRVPRLARFATPCRVCRWRCAPPSPHHASE